MSQYPDTLMVSENRSDVEKMKEALQKKEKTCRTINKVGTALTTIGSPVLVGSLVSPFDIEGPLVEIISGIVLVIGTLMKKFSADELEEIEAIKNNGEYHYQKVSSHIDDEDMQNIRETFETIKEKAQKRKNGGLSR